MNDELREQLGRLDPMHPGVPVESLTTPSSQTRLEHIMNTPLIEEDPSDISSDRPAAHTHHLRRRRAFTIFGGVAAAAVIALGSVAMFGRDDNNTVAAGPPLELSLGGGDALASCLAFDVAFLATMPTAFAGTATSVDGATVTLSADRWYKGGDASSVVLHAASGAQALIDGFDFAVGQHYLITATDGQVNFCGFSGIATPDLTAAFETAFGS